MSWQIQYPKHGVYLPQIDWWLDAWRPVQRSFVSHAHYDHLAEHKEFICTPATARLVRARMRGRRVEHKLAFGQTEQLTPDCTITLHPAGHMLGSAQCLIEHAQHGTLLYTGDFNPRGSRTAEPCATPRADTLVMETTFGKPHYVFPPAEKVLADIIAFCRATLADGATPVLYAYTLGKSQELLAGLALSGIDGAQLPVMLHPETHRLTRVYETLFAGAGAAGNAGFPLGKRREAPPQTPSGNLALPAETPAPAAATPNTPASADTSSARQRPIQNPKSKIENPFPPHTLFDPDPRALAGHVVICPPQRDGDSAFLQNIPARRTAMITGWAVDRATVFRSRCDAAFPLSDHADFNDLLRFVEQVQPRLVHTTHGFADDFARELRARGVEAWPLGREAQMDLSLG